MDNSESKSANWHRPSLWQDFRTRCYFKFVLPRIREIVLEDIRLDVSTLSLRARNRLRNVGYEVAEKLMCRKYLEPRDSVLEIGAAIGFIAMFCQKKIGIRKYIACEANPRTFELLRRNYVLNNVTSTAWNLALGPRDGQVDLEVGSEFWENCIIADSNRATERKTVSVPAATLATIIRKAECKINTLIIDIEGAEQFVRAEEIPRDVEKIIMELHPRLIGPERSYELVAELINSGFRVAAEQDGTFTFIRRAEHRTKRSLLPEVSLSELEQAQKKRAPEAIAAASSGAAAVAGAGAPWSAR